ncbi:hypothetical protein ACFRMQ_00805 [Kitasatospora sp. NPDC056783]|uniref:hypothetical protein n=1 Tax=Kitasatospora sp. NPDC056783 TaxID=3345943 RepID=UPI0036B4D4E1
MKILDVTLRDGGFVNDFRLGLDDARAVVALLDPAGLDGIEIGYLTGLPPNHGAYPHAGPCYALTPEHVADLAAATTTPLVGMLHPGGTEPLDLPALAGAGLSLVRIPVTPNGDGRWHDVADRLTRAAMPFTVNLTLASWADPEAVEACAKTAESAGARMFYVADTNSAFLPDQVEEIFHRLSGTVGLPLGFHAHDCKRLALANVLAARRGGAQWADASLAGLGRGAGNAATEVLHEITGRDAEARHRLLLALPEVTRAFEAYDARQLWQQLCAFLDLWPPAIELFDKAELRTGVDKYERAGTRLLGRELAHPPTEADLTAMTGLHPDGAG